MPPQHRILLTAATLAEIEPTVLWLRARGLSENKNVINFDNSSVEVLLTGVGPVATAFALGDRFSGGPATDLAVQAGIGGAMDRDLVIGSVYQLDSERMGDVGAQAADGAFLSLADIGFHPGAPFGPDEVLRLPKDVARSPFPTAAGVTVSQGTGTEARLAQLRRRWPEAQVESMEGAPFFKACLDAGLAPLALRAISNFVEARNREAWQIGPAVAALNEGLQRLLAPFIQLGS